VPRLSTGVGLAAAVILTGCGITAPAAEPATRPVEPTSEVGSGHHGDAPLDRAVPVIVERVIDGDSLELTIDGEAVEARLLGINAPELRSPTGSETCPGRSARGELEAVIARASVVSFVPDEVDRFDRRLGVVVLDGKPATETMVESGWALALWSGEDELLSRLMIEAAAANRGMWGTACGRPASTDLAITEVLADAPGDDRENLAEEWVTLTNEGVSSVDLDGWVIRDDTTSNRFTITDLDLGPGASIRFRSGQGRSGRGASGDGDYHLGESSPVWSNRGETVLLVDPDGVIAAHAFVLP